MTTSRAKWEFYRDSRGEYRWRKMASNGRIIGASSEGFSSRAGAKRNARLMGYQGQ